MRTLEAEGCTMTGPVYRGISASPQHGSFGPNYDPPPSDLDDLVAGRQRKLTDLVDQTVAERVISGDVNVTFAALAENRIGQLGVVAEDAFGALLVRNRCL
mgnify:CR=1 FL=1